ncbi:unnamed protein product [Timema podura]|uniref:Uncharacterized protein n=1 Tax=Timema podura TaxID=61482 RepID=A0ABN7NGK0_TIMPD|nr:unnamed protein product [Timema podura]
MELLGLKSSIHDSNETTVDQSTLSLLSFASTNNATNKHENTAIPADPADPGVIAGIAIAAILTVVSVAACIGYIVYRHFLHRNLTSMNFDNPVYRKTTEDQFALEKNQFQPQRIYPATVGEEIKSNKTIK